MVADTCTFCWEVLTKPTDRNLVEGKGNWSVELAFLTLCDQALSAIFGWQAARGQRMTTNLKSEI